MVFIRNSEPIQAQAQYITQIKRQFAYFDSYIRENKTIYADAPEYGVPVVLKSVTGNTYISVREELEDLTTEFLTKI